MRILWVTNILLSEAASILQGHSEIKGTGGWMNALADVLHKNAENVQLFVASLSSSVKTITEVSGEFITYYIIPSIGDNSYHKNYENLFREVYERVKPDVIHIHGTEYPHSLACVNGCGVDNVCVSIQGLVSVCQYYYSYGLTNKQILSAITPISVVRNGIKKGYHDFRRRANYENAILRKVRHIIGRTSWDKAHAWAINPDADYYHCGEILRKEFYQGDIWHYNTCKHHSIFVSQAGYPLKGLHQVLKAFPLVLRHYPDACIRVAGTDITCNNSFRDLIRLSDWGIIVRRIIRKEHLQKHVAFIGEMNAQEMKQEYLNCNVFVCPSSIENSPNSLCEAQILGVPCVASYVGGVMDIMCGDENYLYRFEEIEMLAKKICDIFDLQDKIDTSRMRMVALDRHDQRRVVSDLLEIYEHIKKID